MPRSPVILIVSALALAVAGMLSAPRPPQRGPVYSVATVQAGLARDAGAWIGRPILVRGEIVPCMAVPSVGDEPCAALAPSLWEPESAEPWMLTTSLLPLVHVAPPRWLAFLGHVPVLGDLLPAPQPLHWGAAATYRVQVRPVANSICGAGVCYEAVLLGVALPAR